MDCAAAPWATSNPTTATTLARAPNITCFILESLFCVKQKVLQGITESASKLLPCADRDRLPSPDHWRQPPGWPRASILIKLQQQQTARAAPAAGHRAA